MHYSRSSSFTFQLLRMIVDEQHDLQKAKESVYILERGLLKKLIIHVKFPLKFQEIP